MDNEAAQNRQRASTLAEHHGRVLALRTPVWFGKAADRSRLDLRLMLARLAAVTEILSKQAEHVSSAATDLSRIKADQQGVINNAQSKAFRIGDSGLVISQAKLPASLDPRRPWWWAELTGAVVAIAWRLTSLDVSLAVKLGGLVLEDLGDSFQQGAIDLTNSAFAGTQDGLSAANQWLIDTASDLWPDAVGALEAWQKGSESFMGEAARQPRWLQELLYTGNLPAPAEVVGQSGYLLGHLGGDLTGSPFFGDGSPYVPTLRDAQGTPLTAPTSVADLVANMSRPYETSNPDDTSDRPAVEVSVIEGNPPRFIVNIPGTSIPMNQIEGWNSDIEGTDWPADFKAVGYGDSSATQSTKAAIDLAIRNYETTHGVTLDRPNVLLTGHSQGGIIAGNIASDPAFTSRYQVDGIVSAGSPINTLPINQDVPVLNFSHYTDVVPKLDLGGVHEQPNVTEIAIPTLALPGEAHGVDGYARDVAELSTKNSDVQAFNQRLAPYFSGQGNVETYQYDIGRSK